MDELELLRKWLEALMAALDAEVDGKTRAQVMEHCGQACAIHFGSIKKAQAIKHGAKGIGELLDKLNQQDGFWCGMWVKDGATIYSICDECGCPLIRAGLVELGPIEPGRPNPPRTTGVITAPAPGASLVLALSRLPMIALAPSAMSTSSPPTISRR